MNPLFSWPLALVCLLGTVTAPAQVTTTGFLNQPRSEAPGTLLSHPISNGSEPIGRTTSINYLNGWIIVGGEQPGSRAGSDWQLRVYDIGNPSSPVRRLPSDFGLGYANDSWYFGNYGWNAHGTAQTGTMLVPNVIGVGSFGGAVVRGGMSGSGYPGDGSHGFGFNRAAQAGPWMASFPWYGSPDSAFTIEQTWVPPGGGTQYRTLASFDHVGSFGGGDWHPMFFGDLLIYARSGGAGSDGVVVYRMQYHNFDDPNTRSVTPQFVASLSSGFTAYWPTFYSDGTALYVIGSGSNVVMAADITSASVPGGEDAVTLAANLTVPGMTNAPYPVFQDHFGFIHNRKIDMNRLVAGDANPIVLTLNENVPPVPGGQPAAPSGVDTSQMSLALGNLWLTGGYPGGTLGQANYQAQGMGVWVHQQAADTTPPRVSFHIPQTGRTDYPRHAPLSFLIFEHGSRGAPRNGIDFAVRPVGAGDVLGAGVAGTLIHDFSGVLTFTPQDGLAADTTYQVDFFSDAGTQVGWRDAAGNFIEPYSYRFSTGGGITAVAPPVWTSFTASNYQPAPNQPVTVTAAAVGTGALEYRFNFDGTWSAWSASATAQHIFANAGRSRVLAQTRDSTGSVVTNSLALLIITPPPAGPRPTQSATLAVGDDAGLRCVWSVNPDANTVTVTDATTGAKIAEHAVGGNPRSIARDSDGRYWITCFASDEIRILNGDGTLHQTIALEYGDGPFGIVPSPDGAFMYVTLYTSGRLHRYPVASPAAAPLAATGLNTPRAIAISADGGRVFVTRFISPELQGEVAEFSAALDFTRGFPLALANTLDGGDRAAGVPNYLAGIAISPDGTRAAVVSKQDNTLRGEAFGVGDLTHETTVRSVISFLDLANNQEVRNARRDFDNSDSPTAVAYTPLGDTLLVTLQGNNTLVGMDARNLTPLNEPSVNGSTVTQPAVLTLEIGTGLAPQGVLIDAASNRIITQNFMGRSLTILNAQPFLAENRTALPVIATTSTVSAELLPAEVLQGKRIFYNAADTRMGADSYISCATCHVDGGHDGRVWDFTGRAEGFRRTTDLRGRGGMRHGAVHWSGNFDEIQDFEHDIRGPFGGTGFLDVSPQQFATLHPSPASGKTGLSADLDALAAYVSSLTPEHTPRSPNRNASGTLTTAALAGQAVFAAQNCASCHAGSSFTNSALANVGTQSLLSGSRLGQVLTGIDTPTLHGLHASRIYLHHGQAASLSEVFSYVGGDLRYGAQAEMIGSAGVDNDNPLEGGGGLTRGYLGGAAAYLSASTTAGVRFNNVDGGSGGTARIAFRYLRQYNSGTAVLVINGVPQDFTALQQSPNNDWQSSGWRWHSVEAPLNPGATNTLEIQRGPSNDLRVNILLVGHADQITLAQSHRSVQSLGTTDQNNLLAYLSQLDGRDGNGVPLAASALPPPQPPGIVSGPLSQTLAVGNAWNPSVVVSGSGPFTFVWRRGTTIVGTNNAELQISSVTLADAGSYTCTVSNALDSVVTAPAVLAVNAAVTISPTTLFDGTINQPYSADLVASGGVGSRTWSLDSGFLPAGLQLGSDGQVTGTPTAAARAVFAARVTDDSGSATRTFQINIAPIGGFITDPDLILHFTFDEANGNQLWDVSPSGNNHTTTVASAQRTGGGRFGAAYGPVATNGAFANFIPANQSDLNFDPRGEAFTISTWFRTTATTAYHILFSKENPDNSAVQYRSWIVDPNTRLSAVTGNQYGAFIPTSPPLNDGQWHLATLVNFNDNGTWRTRLYYDQGTQFAEYNTGDSGTVAPLMRIGGMSAGWNEWNGQLDDFRVYRRALTQSEVAALYHPTAPSDYSIWIHGRPQPSPANQRGPLDDPDGDGHNNLMEYALGSHPNNATEKVLPTMARSQNSVSLTYPRLRSELVYQVESSTEMTAWQATGINQDPGSALGQPATATLPLPPGTDRIFLRLRVTDPSVGAP
ncbi:MAG: LamG-like jellyroll fold domain-containing protein [Luteolibacter sp.]